VCVWRVELRFGFGPQLQVVGALAWRAERTLFVGRLPEPTMTTTPPTPRASLRRQSPATGGGLDRSTRARRRIPYILLLLLLLFLLLLLYYCDRAESAVVDRRARSTWSTVGSTPMSTYIYYIIIPHRYHLYRSVLSLPAHSSLHSGRPPNRTPIETTPPLVPPRFARSDGVRLAAGETADAPGKSPRTRSGDERARAQRLVVLRRWRVGKRARPAGYSRVGTRRRTARVCVCVCVCVRAKLCCQNGRFHPPSTSRAAAPSTADATSLPNPLIVMLTPFSHRSHFFTPSSLRSPN